MAAKGAILELLKNCSFPHEVLTDKILACVRQHKLGIVPVARYAKELGGFEPGKPGFGDVRHDRRTCERWWTWHGGMMTRYVFQQPFFKNW